MSWDLDFTRKYPCPCGKGEYIESSYSDDWERSKSEYSMLCPECNDKYVYSHALVSAHPGREIERGWVLKSDLIYEENKRKEIFNKIKEQCWDVWVSKFEILATKKSKWMLLSQGGKYYPSLSTFYNQTSGHSKEQLANYINKYFGFCDINRIYEICGRKIDYDFLQTSEIELYKLLRY